MTDISKILTSVLAGGTQQGGAGGLLGQLADMARQGQGGAGGLAGLGGLLGGLSGGQGAGARPAGGGLLDQLAGALRQAQAGGAQPGGAQPGGHAAPASPGDAAAPSAGAPGQGGGSVLDQISAALQGARGEAGSGNLSQILAQLAGTLNQRGGFTGGAALGTLAGLLLGTGAGRKIAGAAARLGGLAAIGGLAYVALRNYREGKPVVQGTIDDVSAMLGVGQAPPQGFAEAAGTRDRTAEILLRAMVAGAYADGDMTAEERALIVGQLDAMGLGPDERTYLDGLLASPTDIRILAEACTSEEMKAQAYIAAHLGMTVDSAEEATFLKDFAQALGLEPGLVAHLDQAAAEAKAARDA